MRFWIREALHMNEEEFLPDKEDMAVNELGTMLHDVLECFCREHAVLKDGMNAASFQDAITEILEQTFRKQYGPSPSCPCCCKTLHGTEAFRLRRSAFAGPSGRMVLHCL